MTGSENMRLAGQNGSGKTTLLSILAGLYEPSTGSVCGGASVGQRRKSTALQEQNGAIFSGTVWENLFLGEDKRPAAEALLEEDYGTSIYRLKSLTDLEDIVGKKQLAERLGDLIVKPEGKLTLVMSDDKRQAVSVAETMFND